MEVISEIPRDGSGHAGDQAMEEFEVTEVELNSEPAFVQLFLPLGHELLHRLVWPDEDPSFMLDVHVTLKLLRDIASVGDNDAIDVTVDGTEDVAVVHSWFGELES